MATIFERPVTAPAESAEQPRPASDTRWPVLRDWATLMPFTLAGGLLICLAWPMLAWWKYEYFDNPQSYYGHAPVIPLLSALMLWHRRDALRAVPKVPAFAALLLLVPALFLLVFSVERHIEAVESTAFLLTIIGGVWLALGGRFLRAAAFPLLFLWLMAPLPGPILNDATHGIQMLSTIFANKLLHLGFATTLSGNVIAMDAFTLSVDVPCSGFKTLLAMLTFSAAFAYLVDGSPARRLGLFLFSLPLSLAVNSIRIALIGVVGECIGASAAHVFHDWSGLIMLVLGFIALFSLAKVLGCRKFAGWDIF